MFLRPAVFLLILLTGTIFFVSAQDEGDDEDDEDIVPIESDWSRSSNLYTRGDQTFCINLGVVLPLFFVDQKEGHMKTQMNLGGMGSLGYNYFFGRHLFLGGELSGMFSSTLGENMFYLVPIGIRGGYQFVLSRFEFPFSLMIGFAPQSFNERSYLGFFAKPAAGAFFRFNSDWSFGLTTSLWWVPQWTNKTRDYASYNNSGSVNIHGFFWEISAGVRYHF